MSVTDTNESRARHSAHIAYVSPSLGTSPSRRSGFLYTCPRCGAQLRVMRWLVGAEAQADDHALTCSGVETSARA